eukprot:5262435-Amphidinium_carterae.1
MLSSSVCAVWAHSLRDCCCRNSSKAGPPLSFGTMFPPSPKLVLSWFELRSAFGIQPLLLSVLLRLAVFVGSTKSSKTRLTLVLSLGRFGSTKLQLQQRVLFRTQQPPYRVFPKMS